MLLLGALSNRILEDGRIGIEGIVGTSAGGMNAAVTAYELTVGGNEGARKSLRQFWEAVAERGACSVMQPSWFDRLLTLAISTIRQAGSRWMPSRACSHLTE